MLVLRVPVDLPWLSPHIVHHVFQDKLITVNIPPGVNDGSRLRVRGEGNAGVRGGPTGDLYVELSVEPSAEFTRDGRTINSSVSIPYTDAILGTEVCAWGGTAQQIGLEMCVAGLPYSLLAWSVVWDETRSAPGRGAQERRQGRGPAPCEE